MSIVFTGTASGHNGLLDKLRAALTNVSLGSEAWTEVAFDTTSVAGERFSYLRGPGLSGTDQIFIGIRQYQDVGSDYYNWEIRGMENYNPLSSLATQPGASPPSYLCLSDSSIPYKIIANGRCFKVIAKVSTTYHSLYAGFYLPYATSAEMPYPIYVCGSTSTVDARWSRGTYIVGSPWDPPSGTGWLRHFDGSWVNVFNYLLSDNTYRQEDANNCIWPWEMDYSIGRNLDGTYGVLPAILHGNYGGGNNWGELDGVSFVTGVSNASEDTVTIGSDVYTVVQSAYRTNRRDYAAIKLG